MQEVPGSIPGGAQIRNELGTPHSAWMVCVLVDSNFCSGSEQPFRSPGRTTVPQPAGRRAYVGPGWPLFGPRPRGSAVLCEYTNFGFIMYTNYGFTLSRKRQDDSSVSGSPTLSVPLAYTNYGFIIYTRILVIHHFWPPWLGLPFRPAAAIALLRRGWMAGWPAGRLAGWPAGWPAGWLAGRLAGWLAGWLAVWLAGWLAAAAAFDP